MHQIVGLGEVLWDVFPDGPRFGGAPANFACAIAGLGADVAKSLMVSAVGNDELGSKAIDALRQHQVVTDYVRVGDHPTGAVNITLNDLNDATYLFAEDVAWDHLTMSEQLEQLASKTSAVCFGSLSQRTPESAAMIQSFVKATPASTMRVFDVNLRPPYWSPETIVASTELATVLKCNESELPMLADVCQLDGDTPPQWMDELIDRFGLHLIALTLGENGSVLVTSDGQQSELSAAPIDVADTVGAGDAFTAAMVLGLLCGHDLTSVHRHAAEVAAHVCAHAGATPTMPPELQFSAAPQR